MAWLLDCGLIKQVFRATKPDLLLKAYLDFSAFKLFMVDVGLMVAKFVFQQLVQSENLVIVYWTSESLKAEIDLLIQYSNEIIPVEIKATKNLQAKSLKTFCQKLYSGHCNPNFTVQLQKRNRGRERAALCNRRLLKKRSVVNYLLSFRMIPFEFLF